jgi:hypothetical protein
MGLIEPQPVRLPDKDRHPELPVQAVDRMRRPDPPMTVTINNPSAPPFGWDKAETDHD